MIRLLLILTISAQAAFIKDGDMIAPFELKKAPIQKFLADYADFMKVQINYTDKKSLTGTVSLKMNRKIGKRELRNTLYEVLANNGLALDIKGESYWIYTARDVRYMPSDITYGELGEINSEYVLYVYELKNYLGNQIARNLRPFMSRYGRIIDVRNTNTLIISDTKKNINRLKTIISRMDNKNAIENLLNSKTKKNEYRLKDYNQMKNENQELKIDLKAMVDKMSKGKRE